MNNYLLLVFGIFFIFTKPSFGADTFSNYTSSDKKNNENEIQNLHATVKFVDNIEKYVENEFIAKNITLLTFEKLPSSTSKLTDNYKFGKRNEGDKVVATGKENFNYPENRNLVLIIRYPATKTSGVILSYIEVQIQTSSGKSEVHIKNGGPQYDFAELVMTAENTKTFSYTASFYTREI